MQEKNTLMGVLAYLGPLVIVSLLVAKDDPFVRFHVKQGLVLLIIEVVIYLAWSFLWAIFWPLWPLYQLLNLAVLVLSIVGIVNVVQGHEKPLPVVGSWGHGINI